MSLFLAMKSFLKYAKEMGGNEYRLNTLGYAECYGLSCFLCWMGGQAAKQPQPQPLQRTQSSRVVTAHVGTDFI